MLDLKTDIFSFMLLHTWTQVEREKLLEYSISLTKYWPSFPDQKVFQWFELLVLCRWNHWLFFTNLTFTINNKWQSLTLMSHKFNSNTQVWVIQESIIYIRNFCPQNVTTFIFDLSFLLCEDGVGVDYFCFFLSC